MGTNEDLGVIVYQAICQAGTRWASPALEANWVARLRPRVIAALYGMRFDATDAQQAVRRVLTEWIQDALAAKALERVVAVDIKIAPRAASSLRRKL